jgi:DHA2 family multidrug resistance protein
VGLAPTLGSLIVFRVIQGATGGALQPLSQAVLLESFKPEDRGKAMGFWGLGIVCAPILGPVFGGWLTENYNWRWVFYINIPVGAMSIFMISRYVFDPAYLRKESKGIDFWGMGLLVLGIGALQFVLDKGQSEDWFESNLITTLAILSAVSLAVLIYYELFGTKDPIVDLRVFKNRTYATGVFLMTVVGFVLYGSMVLLPVMMQTLFGYSALEAGKAMSPRGVGSLIMMPMVGLLTTKIDPRKLLATGLTIGAITMLWLGTINLNASQWHFMLPQFLQGAGMALLFVPLTTVSMATINPQRMGYATSLFNLMRNIGGSIGIAATGTMLARNNQSTTALLGANVTPYDPASQAMLAQMKGAFMAAGADPATATDRAHAAVFGLVQRQATMMSFVGIFQLLGIMFIALIPLVLLMRRPKAGGHVAAH